MPYDCIFREYVPENVYAEERFKTSIRILFMGNSDNRNICPDLLLHNLLIYYLISFPKCRIYLKFSHQVIHPD